MTRLIVSVALSGLVAIGLAAQSAAPLDKLFASAEHNARVAGDLKGAIEDYKRIVATAGKDRSAAARALLLMAEAYQKLNDAEAARRIYERLVREYGDQKDAVSIARAQLHQPSVRTTVEPRLLCEQCGGVGSVSRDGRWFVVSNIHSGGDIERRSLSSNTVERMRAKSNAVSPAQGGSQAYWPILSGDSRQIAFAFNPGSLRQDPSLSHARLMVMPNQPGAPARVLVNNPEIAYPVPIGWRGNNAILTLAMKPDQTWQLMWVDAGTGTTTVLKSLEWRVGELARAATLSPDGRYVAYAAASINPPAPGGQAEGANDRIYLLSGDGRSETTLTPGAGAHRHPVWTPDGSHVVYVSDVSGTFDLWAIPVRDGRAAGKPKLLRKDIGDIVSLGMTDNGVYHYFSARSGVHRASIVPIGRSAAPAGASRDGGRGTVESFVGQAPRWSPDGRSIAVIRRRPAAAGVFDLVVRDLTAATERVFRHDGLIEQRPTWFPDGRSLLLAADAAQRWWFRLDVESGRFIPLVNHAEAQKRS